MAVDFARNGGSPALKCAGLSGFHTLSVSPGRGSAMKRASRLLFTMGALFLSLLTAGYLCPSAMAQAQVQGQWSTLPNPMPINPIHVSLMHTGKVLVVSGSGNVAGNNNFQAAIFDPSTGTVTPQNVGWDMFCNAIVVLPDGRPFVQGGTLQYDPFHGELRSSAYDPLTGQFVDLQSMAHGRWYPTATTLSDGSLMIFPGLNETGGTNTAVEIYTVGSGWSQEYGASWTPPLYPRMHLLPNGTVFYSGSGTGSRIFTPSTKTWSGVVANTIYTGTRTYGTSVLLPLTPANGYKPRVMIFGGGSPATATTEIIDLSASNPNWQSAASMSQPRIEMNAVILPNGKVLALGGSTNDEDASTASLNADLFDPSTNPITSSSAGANAYARLYHSGALLLPDATVWVAGGNPARGTYELNMEVYSPAYLFASNGSPATRPTITTVAPGVIGFGSSFQVQTPNAANIASVVLVRPGSPTHAFDMDQRLVGLSFTVGSGVLNVTGPPNGNIAPPGYYMLFILNTAGVPSVATFVQVSPAATDQPPTGTITSPGSNQTIGVGQSAYFSGTGSDTDGTVTGYSWVFPGGTPNSSALANPGNVTFSTAGTYVASLTVTDNAGRTDPSPPTRTITVVPDFSLSATPASRSVSPGGSTSYTATVAPGTGFTGTVAFSVSGLPSGATATFNPTTVNTSGSTTMSVVTSSSSPTGSYPLTITGSSGGLSHTAPVTLVVVASSGGSSAISHVQQTFNSDPTGTTHTAFSATFGLNTTSGNAIIVGVTYGNVDPTITVTDSRGNTYARAIKTYDIRHSQGVAIFYAVNIAGGASHVVTVNFSSGTNYLGLGIHEYSGLSALDAVSGNTGSGTSLSSNSATTTANGDLAFGNGVEDSIGNSDTLTPGSGYTKRVDLANVAGYADADQVQATAGAISSTWTLSPSGRDWIADIATFKASGGGPPAPSITNLNPTSGAVGAPVTITGTNFGATQGSSTVTFNGTLATPTSWSSTSIAAPVPTGATTGNVVVTVGGVASNGSSFTVTSPAPSITNLNPTSGTVGTSVTITGTNFGTTQGSSTVTFNGTAATPTSWSATSIVAPVPAGATTGNVVVTVGGVASNGVSFTVAPSITSLTPTAGAVGTSVTITGTSFGTTQGTSTVTFNGTAATPTSWSATSIVAPVPAGATTGNVV